jgi:nitrous oxidase accessory protein
MIRKCLAVGIILLFVEACIIPTIAQDAEKQSLRGNWLYVGGGGPGNYTKIQDAINDSSNGDIIFVYNGTYYENVRINKVIMLLGQNTYGTVIDGGGVGNVVYITAESATIRDFTIRGGGPSTNESCAGIKVDAMEVKIYNNIIVNNSDFGIVHGGVYWRNSSTDISNNIIQRNGWYGICLLWHHNWIYGNTISENQDGIILKWDSGNNIVKSNIIMENDNTGINLQGDSNTIQLNTVRNNNRGIEVSHSCSNTIENNIIQNNADYGIVLEMYWDKEEVDFSLNNNITENVISGSSYGIKVEEKCDNNRIHRNNITNNTQGFYTDISNNNNIEQNNFIENTKNAYYRTYWRYNIIFNQNYWDDLHGTSKKIIMGKKALFPLLLPDVVSFYWFFIPCFKFDTAPAQKPYDIPSMR